jgi:hypothetical protein
LAVAPFTHPQGDVYYQHFRLQEDSFAKQYPRYTAKGIKHGKPCSVFCYTRQKKKKLLTAGRTNGDATCLASLIKCTFPNWMAKIRIFRQYTHQPFKFSACFIFHMPAFCFCKLL